MDAAFAADYSSGRPARHGFTSKWVDESGSQDDQPGRQKRWELLNAATIPGATSSSESREVGRTAGISSQIRPAATVVAAAMTIAAALTTGPASATARGIDWNAVGHHTENRTRRYAHR
jgi:hypothetical protein